MEQQSIKELKQHLIKRFILMAQGSILCKKASPTLEFALNSVHTYQGVPSWCTHISQQT